MTSSISDSATLKARARALGFEDLGITSACTRESAQQGLTAFLENGYHGEMAWMADTAERRLTPQAMWPDARTALVLTANYGPASSPLEDIKRHRHATISVYARHRDYHDVLKKRLKALAREVARDCNAQVKVFVDTAPLMEKPLAQQSGLGWQGKHSNLVSRSHGSWLFLGVILTDAVIEPDVSEDDHCGGCRACLDICPTQAFPAPYMLDARRCISYLTIEYKGHIPREFRRPMGNRIYGCDDCLAVCPWNKFAQVSRDSAFHARPELTAPLLSDLLGLDDAAFREVFSASPIKRIGRDRFMRNVLIAAGNSGAPEIAAAVHPHLEDANALVRAMAVWALSALGESVSLPDEQDPAVLSELALAGQGRRVRG